MPFFFYVQLIPGRECINVFTPFFKPWKLLWPVSQLEYHCCIAMFVCLISNSYRLYLLYSTWLNWVCRISNWDAHIQSYRLYQCFQNFSYSGTDVNNFAVKYLPHLLLFTWYFWKLLFPPNSFWKETRL